MIEQVGTSCTTIVDQLAARIDDVLQPLLPRGSRCALLDFPNNSNVGDSAIWLGEVEWLRRRGVEIVYACDKTTYSRKHLAERIGTGPILLNGGGNLGDFWIEHEWFRERVIQDFPENPIVQLPQTIHFIDAWDVSEAQRIFNVHQRLTILCRDEQSLDFARTQFAATSLLCPDMAFAIGAIPRPARAEHAVIWLCRTDAESQLATASAIPADSICVDWLDESPTPLIDRNRTLSEQLDPNRADDETLDALMATYEPVARERLPRGCRLLSQARIVVTDRLHGHILCLLMGLPHVLLDNNYGKVRNFYETWTHDCPLARWADSPTEALELVSSD